MKDQVDGLQGRGIRATLINSTLDPAELRARLHEIEAGHYDLVYVAPERFRSNRFVEVLGRVRPAILAVDEAHCISEWGHDFRPDYARIGQARRRLGSPPCIALTATATDMVRRDIAEGLDLRDPAMFVTGFDRPNLHYAVVEARRDDDKLSALAEALERMPGAGDRLRLEPGSLRVHRAVSQRAAEPLGRRLSRGPHARGTHPGARAVHGGRGRDRRGDQRLRHGDRQGRRPIGHPLQPDGDPGGVLPGSRPGGPRRPGRPVRAPLRPRRPLPPGAVHRERIPLGPRPSTGSTTSCAGWMPTRSS